MDELKKKFLTLCGKASKEYIYYAPALTRVRIEKDDDRCSTMSMSPCFVMRYNSEFIKSINDQNLTQLILHEILHYLSKHHQRYNQRIHAEFCHIYLTCRQIRTESPLYIICRRSKKQCPDKTGKYIFAEMNHHSLINFKRLSLIRFSNSRGHTSL